MRHITVIVAVALVSAGIGFTAGRLSSTGDSITALPFAANVAGAPTPQNGDTMLYSSDLYHFSLRYPKELTAVSDTDEGDGAHTIVFESSNRDKGFQVYVRPYKGTTIAREDFLADNPSGVMSDPTDVLIDGSNATIFYSKAEGIGDTREVWFIHKGFLYEIVTYKALDTWLAEILKTWQFKN